MAPLMVIVMVAAHTNASPGIRDHKSYGACIRDPSRGITCSVHFVIITVSRQIAPAGFLWASLFFSFEWQSEVHTRHPCVGRLLCLLDALRRTRIQDRPSEEESSNSHDRKRRAESRGVDRCAACRHKYPEYRSPGPRRGRSGRVSSAGCSLRACPRGPGRGRVMCRNGLSRFYSSVAGNSSRFEETTMSPSLFLKDTIYPSRY